MIYVLGLTGYFICGFAFQEGGIGLIGVSNLGVWPCSITS